MADKDSFRMYHLDDYPSWTQYLLMAKSLLKAIEVSEPEETLMIQLTLAELSVITFGMVALCRMFPEFRSVANSLSDKITELGQAQDFLADGTLDNGE